VRRRAIAAVAEHVLPVVTGVRVARRLAARGTVIPRSCHERSGQHGEAQQLAARYLPADERATRTLVGARAPGDRGRPLGVSACNDPRPLDLAAVCEDDRLLEPTDHARERPPLHVGRFAVERPGALAAATVQQRNDEVEPVAR
jgi:hypothetical protein